jgi:hypothetical protein
MDKEDLNRQTISISISIFNRLTAIVLTESGEVQIISATAANLLDRYFDEKLNSHQLPDSLKIWVEQQLRLQQSELIAPSQPWQIKKNGRKLSVDLLCDFAAKQHWLICCDRFSKAEATCGERSRWRSLSFGHPIETRSID